MFSSRTNWNLEPNRLSEALARHRAAGKALLDLTASNPTKCGLHYDSDTILRALANPNSLVYEPQAQGIEGARRAVSQYYADRGENVASQDIVLTTSTSEAYSFAFRLLCEPGNEVLVPAPSYPLFDFLADIQDVKLARYPLVYDHGWQVDFGALETAITSHTRAIIIVHPNNPTGHFCASTEAKRLSEVCSRHQMALIADEVFLDFALSANAARSFVVNEDALTFTLSGLSKISGLPQMKLAWLIVGGPTELKAQALSRLEVIADTYLSTNAPVQHAAETLLEQRHAFQRQLMRRVRNNLAELDRQLAAQSATSRLEVQGGWYAVIRVPRTRSDEELALELLSAKNVFVHPGHFFDFPDDGNLVISLITPESEFAKGIEAVLRTAYVHI